MCFLPHVLCPVSSRMRLSSLLLFIQDAFHISEKNILKKITQKKVIEYVWYGALCVCAYVLEYFNLAVWSKYCYSLDISYLYICVYIFS